MSDTPLTDAQLNKTWKGIHAAYVPMAFARELERENAKLRKMLEAVMPSKDFQNYLKSLLKP